MGNPYELDKAEHDRRYSKIATKYLSSSEPKEKPRAIIIGGQAGSGKGTLTQQAAREMFKEGGVVLVDVDALRSRHPQNNQLMRDNDRQAANLTHNDASKWAKRLTNDAIEGKRNLVIDQTSKSPDSLVARTTQLREAGYHVELRVMAVNAETSEQRVHTRYENQRAKYGAGRFVPKEAHDAAYVGVPESVAAVERSKTVDALSIYDKHQNRIYENTLHNGEWVQQPPGGRAALEAERNRPLTLQDHKEQADAYGKLSQALEARGASPAEREGIEAQRLKVERRLAAETFRQLPAAEALKTHPELAGAYAAVAAMSAKAKEDGLTPDQRQVVMARTRYNVASAIEAGQPPKIQMRETEHLNESSASSGKDVSR
jgi:predicted ABC-type ATPase